VADGGVEVVERTLPGGFAGIMEAHHFIMASELAAVHRTAFAVDADSFPPKIAERIRMGLEMQAVDYVGALRHRLRLMAQMETALADVDAAVFPAAVGPAPLGLDSTGNASFNTLASICGLPAVALPAALSREGLPLGLQLVGRERHDDDLLSVAAWCESVLAFDRQPGA